MDNISNWSPLLKKSEENYIDSIKNQLAENKIEGIYEFFEASDNQKELLGISILVPKDIWQEIRTKIIVPPPTCILSTSIIDDDYILFARQELKFLTWVRSLRSANPALSARSLVYSSQLLSCDEYRDFFLNLSSAVKSNSMIRPVITASLSLKY